MKRNVFYFFLIIIGALIVLYLSWVSSPKIGGNVLIPSWIAYWVDAYRYNEIRTAVPMVFLGVLSGFMILSNKLDKKTWGIIAWLSLTVLISIAEIGQYFRPMRSFDLKDIAWGSIGSGFGLLVAFIGAGVFNKMRHTK
ncbi:hypothetical protein [Confluentibacter sediminis]|uniref:hypothetical protein n=1 Tax=Confluentibacter sediminis TaxID=2219045 RepID=UPI000DAE5988|nr:hypothetical protein [Confluentibacter sediminis]